MFIKDRTQFYPANNSLAAIVLSHDTVCFQFLTNLLFIFYLVSFLENQGERFNRLKDKVNRNFSSCLTV